MKKRITLYEVLVFIAYGFYILFGAIWFVISFANNGHFNYQAFTIIVAFAVQAYFRHNLTNLILGLLTLILSIFMMLEVISSYDLMAKTAKLDTVGKTLLSLSTVSIALSIILVFSYVKLSLKDE
jgi:hypothetical protein